MEKDDIYSHTHLIYLTRFSISVMSTKARLKPLPILLNLGFKNCFETFDSLGHIVALVSFH